MTTEIVLKHALELTRTQRSGLELKTVAQVIKEAFDEAEMKALINELQK